MKNTLIYFASMLVTAISLMLTGCGEDHTNEGTGKEPGTDAGIPTSAELLKKTMYVYEQVDLLEGVTLKEGVKLIKVEVAYDGQREMIADIHEFVPQVLGYATFYFTFSTPDKQTTEVSKQKYIYPQTYQKPVFTEVYVVNDYVEKYQSMSNLAGYYDGTKRIFRDLLAPYLPVCYIAREMYWSDAIVYIMAMEAPEDGWNVEILGQEERTSHGSTGCLHLRMMSPNAVIKAGPWENIEEYVNTHPEKMIFISCAAGVMGRTTCEEAVNSFSPTYYALRRIMEKDNVIALFSSGNSAFTINENEKSIEGDYQKIPVQFRDFFREASLNSKKNNKITVQGRPVLWNGSTYTPNPAEEAIFLGYDWVGTTPTPPSGYCASSILYGFDNVTGNIVMPFFQYDSNTQSSFATACLSSALSNFLAILVKKNTGITLERAMTILKDKYLYTGRTKWQDADGVLHPGHLWNMIDVKKFVEEELLYKSDIESAITNASSDEVNLPGHATVCYSGAGVQFEVDGKKYEMNSENLPLYKNAVLAGKTIKWTFSRNLAASKYGISADKYAFSAYLADNKGNIIADYKLEDLKIAAGNGQNIPSVSISPLHDLIVHSRMLTNFRKDK